MVIKHFHSAPAKTTSWKQNKRSEKNHPFKISPWVLNLATLSSHYGWPLFPPTRLVLICFSQPLLTMKAAEAAATKVHEDWSQFSRFSFRSLPTTLGLSLQLGGVQIVISNTGIPPLRYNLRKAKKGVATRLGSSTCGAALAFTAHLDLHAGHSLPRDLHAGRYPGHLARGPP